MGATEAEIERTWNSLVYRSEVSDQEIQGTFERFGGAEYFGRAPSNSQGDHLLTVLTCHGGLSDEAVADTIAVTRKAKGKVSKREVNRFGSHPSTLQDFERFSEFWRLAPAGLLRGLSSLETKWLLAHPKWRDLRFTVTDPALVASVELCDVARIRSINEDVRTQTLSTAASGVIELVWAEALGKATSVRDAYADLSVVHEDHWVLLARDSARAVMNRVARNRLLPVEVAAELVRTHRTPALRADVMQNSTNKDLLLEVYASTTSRDVRRTVARNPLSELYLTNPAALS